MRLFLGCIVLVCCASTNRAADEPPAIVLKNYEQAAIRQRDKESDQKRWTTAWWVEKKSPEELVKLASELNAKWKPAHAEEYVDVMRTVSVVLFTQTHGNPDALRDAVEIGRAILKRIPELRMDSADLTLFHFMQSVTGLNSTGKTVIQSQDRELALNAFLDVISRVEAHFQENKNPPPMLMPTRPSVPGGVSQIDEIPLGAIRDPEKQAIYAANITKWHQEAAEQAVYHTFAPERRNRRIGLQNDFARYVQNYFMILPEDLDILERSFDKHIKNPELKERLILKCFNGVNPFLDRPSRKEASTAGKPSDVRSRIEAQMRGKTQGGASASSAGGLPGESASSGAQTAVGIQSGSTALGVALGLLGLGGIGFIVLRARSRRNS